MNNQSMRLVELLESRRLLSGAGLTAAGVLHVSGAGGAPNTIDVELSADGTTITVDVQSPAARGATSLHKTFNAGGVKRIDVFGGNRDDSLTVNTDVAPFSIPTRVFGLNGNDSIVTGAENDFIDGGVGNDIINAGDGANRVRGFKGNDNITTGANDDLIDGGVGDDVINSGAGNDIIRGDAGNDTIDAGAGNDTLRGGKGNDTLMGGDDNDMIWGAKGDDVELGGNGDDTLGGVVGNNHLIGGAGHDTFVVVGSLAAQNATNDFNAAEDVLQLVTPKDKTDATDGPTI